MHLKQPKSIYRACTWIPKFREIGDLKDISKNQLEKVSFVHDEAYSDAIENYLR